MTLVVPIYSSTHQNFRLTLEKKAWNIIYCSTFTGGNQNQIHLSFLGLQILRISCMAARSNDFSVNLEGRNLSFLSFLHQILSAELLLKKRFWRWKLSLIGLIWQPSSLSLVKKDDHFSCFRSSRQWGLMTLILFMCLKSWRGDVFKLKNLLCRFLRIFQNFEIIQCFRIVKVRHNVQKIM